MISITDLNQSTLVITSPEWKKMYVTQ